jgi:zinc transporter 1/2/3
MSKMEITSTTAAVESIEFGCVAHSIILGLSLGLQGELSTATNLLIVFLLHQLLEAICLSHLIASLQNRMEMIIMCTLTVGSMPVGIAIGIIISQSANGQHLAPYTHTRTVYSVYSIPLFLLL